jgi:hypothetical protein
MQEGWSKVGRGIKMTCWNCGRGERDPLQRQYDSQINTS